VVADSERILGPGDVLTLGARRDLATAYSAAGRPAEAVMELRRALGDCERYLGEDHPLTGAMRDSLQAASGLSAGACPQALSAGTAQH
jgi:hypothetical protein